MVKLFSHSVMSNSLRPHGLQHARFPCNPPSPGVCSNSSPLGLRCHPSTSSSVTSFSCLLSFPASGSFQSIGSFTSGGQSIGASTSVLPMNIQGWVPLGLTGEDSTFIKFSAGTSRVAQWIRIHLSMQGTWVQSLVRKDSIFHGASKPVGHNYWTCALEPTGRNYWAPVPSYRGPRAESLCPATREATAMSSPRSPQVEKARVKQPRAGNEK